MVSCKYSLPSMDQECLFVYQQGKIQSLYTRSLITNFSFCTSCFFVVHLRNLLFQLEQTSLKSKVLIVEVQRAHCDVMKLFKRYKHKNKFCLAIINFSLFTTDSCQVCSDTIYDEVH